MTGAGQTPPPRKTEPDLAWPPGKTFGELTPAQRQAAIRRTARQLEAELQANAAAIGRIMDADLDIPEPGDGYGSDVRDWEDPDTDRLADGIAAGIVARCATRADLDAAERIVSATRYL